MGANNNQIAIVGDRSALVSELAAELRSVLTAESAMDVRECAAFLGVSEGTVRALVAHKAIPHFRLSLPGKEGGGQIRFWKHEVINHKF